MATLQQQLDEALAARHAWRTGQTRTSISMGGRTVQYSTEGLRRLDAYIGELRRQISGVRPVRNRIRIGVSNEAMETAAMNGEDWNAVYAQRLREVQQRKADGLWLPQTPAARRRSRVRYWWTAMCAILAMTRPRSIIRMW